MLIKIPKASDCHESDVTPEAIYLSRRQLLGATAAGIAVSSLPRWASATDAPRYSDVESGKAPAWFAEKLLLHNGGRSTSRTRQSRLIKTPRTTTTFMSSVPARAIRRGMLAT